MNALLNKDEVLQYLKEYETLKGCLPTTPTEIVEYLNWVSEKLNKDNNK